MIGQVKDVGHEIRTRTRRLAGLDDTQTETAAEAAPRSDRGARAQLVNLARRTSKQQPAEADRPTAARTPQPPPANGGGSHPWYRLKIAAEAPIHGPNSRIRLITSRPADPAAEAFDQLRTRSLRALKENGWTRIAVTSPTEGCGATFTAGNLALSLSRLDTCRALAMDLDLRAPGLAASFGIRRIGPMLDVLTGARAPERHLFRIGPNLALGLNDAPMTGSGAILQHPDTAEVLDDIQAVLEPDVTIYDLPPMLGRDEVEAFLPNVDCVLLVADGTRTTGRQITECERLLQGQTPLLGVVLNRGEIRKTATPRRVG